ncbi:MAG: DUF6660 family protein [Ferruginibacter sp.]
MKFFTFILAIMILALGAMPCMDEPYAINQAKSNAQISVAHNTNDHNDSDACSPFCTCSCCSSAVTFLTVGLLNQHAIFAPAKMYPSYLPSTIFEISLPIWQPPQLS